MIRPLILQPARAMHGAIIALALLLAVFTVIFLHWSFNGFVALFNSDSAANVLFGHEIVAQGRLFPQWNDSTWIFFPLISPNLALMPLTAALMPDWFSAFRVAIALDQALMFGLLWWALGRGGLSRASRLCLLAFLVIGPSWQFLWQTTGIALKSWLFAYIVLLALACERVMDAGGERTQRRWMLLLILAGGAIFVDAGNVATIVPGLAAAIAIAQNRVAALSSARTPRASRRSRSSWFPSSGSDMGN